MATKEKFEEAKRLYETANADQRYVLESLFPELKESEDERIRKELLQIAKESEDSFYMVMTPNKRERLIAWLEKQAQKPVWSEEDKNMLEWVTGYLENKMLNAPMGEERTACKNAIVWLKDLKDRVQPQLQWKPSDEQIKALDDAIAICSERDYETECKLDNLRQELKKLREE